MGEEKAWTYDNWDFDSLFNAYYPRLLLYAIKVIQNKEQAEEIVQDVFMRFWLNSGGKKINYSIKAYLFRSVLNACIDFQQKEETLRKRNHTLTIPSDIIEFEDPVLLEELNVAVKLAIEKLPDKCKEIFTLSREEGFSNKEISQKLDVSVKTVENQITRAIKKIKINISDYLPFLF